MKESFGTITMQFTLAPVRNRNLSYVFSGPTNIRSFLIFLIFFSKLIFLVIPSWLLAHPCQRGYYTFLVIFETLHVITKLTLSIMFCSFNNATSLSIFVTSTIAFLDDFVVVSKLDWRASIYVL